MVEEAGTKTFEEAMQRLEEIVTALEAPELALEEAMQLYREGALCSRYCREKLEQAKHQLEIWQNDESQIDIEGLTGELDEADRESSD